MTPIVSHPRIVRMYAPFFEGLFSKPQHKHFQRFLTGLIVGTNHTVTGINDRFVGRNDQSSLNRFLTESPWPEEELNRLRLQLLQEHGREWKESGCVSIDDVLIEKSGKKIIGVGKLFDHCTGNYVQAQQLVTSHYVDSDTHYPLHFAQYFKRDSDEAHHHGFQSKIDLACQLVDDAIQRGCPARVFLFDSWYLCTQLTSHIESYGRDWIGAVKSNRKILIKGRYMQIHEFAATLDRNHFREIELGHKRYRVFTRSVRMAQLGNVRIVIAYETGSEKPIYLATNVLYWEGKKILALYGRRWSIETFYRDAKQHLGLGDCQLRRPRGIRRYWYLVFLAYSLLKLDVEQSRIGRWIDTNLGTIGEQCRNACKDLVQSLVEWVYTQLIDEDMNKVNVHYLVEALLA